MKITLESTDMIVDVFPDGHLAPGKRPVPARIWEGHTETGIQCKPPTLMPRSYDMRFFLD